MAVAMREVLELLMQCHPNKKLSELVFPDLATEEGAPYVDEGIDLLDALLRNVRAEAADNDSDSEESSDSSDSSSGSGEHPIRIRVADYQASIAYERIRDVRVFEQLRAVGDNDAKKAVICELDLYLSDLTLKEMGWDTNTMRRSPNKKTRRALRILHERSSLMRALGQVYGKASGYEYPM